MDVPLGGKTISTCDTVTVYKAYRSLFCILLYAMQRYRYVAATIDDKSQKVKD